MPSASPNGDEARTNATDGPIPFWASEERRALYGVRVGPAFAEFVCVCARVRAWLVFTFLPWCSVGVRFLTDDTPNWFWRSRRLVRGRKLTVVL